MGKIHLVLIGLVALAGFSARAESSCLATEDTEYEYIGSQKTCAAAVAAAWQCGWGSLRDLPNIDAAAAVCEPEVYPALPDAKARMENEQNKCEKILKDGLAETDGTRVPTMYRSEYAFCILDSIAKIVQQNKADGIPVAMACADSARKAGQNALNASDIAQGKYGPARLNSYLIKVVYTDEAQTGYLFQGDLKGSTKLFNVGVIMDNEGCKMREAHVTPAAEAKSQQLDFDTIKGRK